MYTTHDEWIRLECGQCKYFRECKRLDHKHLRFAKKVFIGYYNGHNEPYTCADFEPCSGIPYLSENWNEIKLQIVPYGKGDIIYLNVDENPEVRYAVDANDFYNNCFLNEDGSLKWLYKYYCKQSRKSPTGYKIVYESPDGTVSENRPLLTKEAEK